MFIGRSREWLLDIAQTKEKLERWQRDGKEKG
jgi:hypothetical protein